MTDPLSISTIGQAGCKLLLLMDVFEHAFVFDYGLKKPDYIAAFFRNINWETVNGPI